MTPQQLDETLTIEQRRARRAWQRVSEVDKWPDGESKASYRRRVQAAPAMVLVNGLGQTAAFLQKGETPEQKLFEHLSEYLKDRFSSGESQDTLLTMIVERWDGFQYRRATEEALAFLTWLKRLAEAKLPKGEANQ